MRTKHSEQPHVQTDSGVDTDVRLVNQTEQRSMTPHTNGRPIALTPNMSLADCPTSLDIRDRKQRSMLFSAGNPGDYEFDMDNTLRIKAHHWLIFPDSRTDEETGEVTDFARLVLFDKDGRFYRCSSQFAPMRLKAALELYPREDWQDGISFVVRRRPSKRHPGGSYHDIRIEE